jgi:hypothetical protein
MPGAQARPPLRTIEFVAKTVRRAGGRVQSSIPSWEPSQRLRARAWAQPPPRRASLRLHRRPRRPSTGRQAASEAPPPCQLPRRRASPIRDLARRACAEPGTVTRLEDSIPNFRWETPRGGASRGGWLDKLGSLVRANTAPIQKARSGGVFVDTPSDETMGFLGRRSGSSQIW